MASKTTSKPVIETSVEYQNYKSIASKLRKKYEIPFHIRRLIRKPDFGGAVADLTAVHGALKRKGITLGVCNM